MTYSVQYLCTYRPIWYDDGPEWPTYQQAVWRAMQITAARRTQTRVLDAYGRVVWPLQ